MNESKNPMAVMQRVVLAILESVTVTDGLGAPAGVMYAALQSHGATLDQFNSMMSGLVEGKLLTHSMDCYFITETGELFREKLALKFSGESAAPFAPGMGG